MAVKVAGAFCAEGARPFSAKDARHVATEDAGSVAHEAAGCVTAKDARGFSKELTKVRISHMRRFAGSGARRCDVRRGRRRRGW